MIHTQDYLIFAVNSFKIIFYSVRKRGGRGGSHFLGCLSGLVFVPEAHRCHLTDGNTMVQGIKELPGGHTWDILTAKSSAGHFAELGGVEERGQGQGRSSNGGATHQCCRSQGLGDRIITPRTPGQSSNGLFFISGSQCGIF
jgi:hypothetical protein